MTGIAAGIVSFLLTVLVLDQLLTKSTERTWAPVNRLALTDFLHALADEDYSEISRGRIVARSLSAPRSTDEPVTQIESLRGLRSSVVEAHQELTVVLSRWAEFLASSGNYELSLRHVAANTLQLDSVRDLTLEVENHPNDEGIASTLTTTVTKCNKAFTALVEEIKSRVAFGA